MTPAIGAAGHPHPMRGAQPPRAQSVFAAVGLGLFLAAMVVPTPSGLDATPVVKALVWALGAACCAAGVRTWVVERRVALVTAVCLVAATVAVVRSVVPVVSWWGRYPRYEGALVLALYLLCVVAGARLVGSTHVVRRVLTLGGPAVSMVVLVVALVQVAGPGSAREGSTLGNAAELGAFGAVLLAGSLAAVWSGLVPDGRLRGWVLAGAAAAGGSLLVSGSRAALLAAVLAVVLAAVLTRPGWRPVLGVVGVALVLGLAGWWLGVGGVARSLDSSAGAVASVTGRAVLWSDTWSLLRAHPWTGVGPSGFVDAIGSAHSARWAAEVGPTNPPDSPHLLPLQLLAAGGLVGLSCVALLGFAALRPAAGALRTRRPGAVVAVVGLGAYVLATSVEFTSPVLTPAAALAAGWLVAVPAPETESRHDVAFRWVTSALAALVALVLAAAVVAESSVAAALTSLEGGDAAGAGQRFEAARTWAPWNHDLRLREGHASTQAVAAQWVPASTCLAPTASAVDLLVTSSEAALDRALCLEANGDLSGASRVLADARTRDPYNTDLWLSAGVIAAEAGHLDDAIALLVRATELSPSRAEPWTDLAVVYRRAGKTDLADAAHARASELSR